ncbi:hypothetical protein ACUH7Y_06985 [Clostridium beijerinckii]|uniref:Uncharacterized protein n=1 Tax=Clostridium beijerinckii TaxID=1520 RepID=A0A7X9SQL0_CLOBE|nr:hypothetical protein [Clostridium beijerinckii]NMF06277.1 hypothetical protein [Clostridium beijerinckii]
MRSIDEIIDQAVKNTLLRLRTDKPIEIVNKRTGNKKALHQKGKNKVKSWKV